MFSKILSFFWVAGMILKAWDVKFEPAFSFGIKTSEKTLCDEHT